MHSLYQVQCAPSQNTTLQPVHEIMTDPVNIASVLCLQQLLRNLQFNNQARLSPACYSLKPGYVHQLHNSLRLRVSAQSIFSAALQVLLATHELYNYGFLLNTNKK